MQQVPACALKFKPWPLHACASSQTCCDPPGVPSAPPLCPPPPLLSPIPHTHRYLDFMTEHLKDTCAYDLPRELRDELASAIQHLEVGWVGV